jgi:hypothetical protein
MAMAHGQISTHQAVKYAMTSHQVIINIMAINYGLLHHNNIIILVNIYSSYSS